MYQLFLLNPCTQENIYKLYIIYNTFSIDNVSLPFQFFPSVHTLNHNMIILGGKFIVGFSPQRRRLFYSIQISLISRVHKSVGGMSVLYSVC